MKKICAVLCMLTCIFGLTACGNEQTVNESTKTNQQMAESLTKGTIGPLYSQFVQEELVDGFLEEYTAEEAAYIMESLLAQTAYQNGLAMIDFEGAGVLSSMSSFKSGYDTIGTISEYGEVSSEVKDDEIIVTVLVKGEKKDGSIEAIFSNDIFLTVKACSLNADMSLGDMMQKAGLNTLLGMGTVFCVLILIMLIISAFGIIPKLQKMAEDKKAGKKNVETQTEAPAAAVVEAVQEELTDDYELVAVIAAAIAASEGSAGTDGFVVRSIRRASRR